MGSLLLLVDTTVDCVGVCHTRKQCLVWFRVKNKEQHAGNTGKININKDYTDGLEEAGPVSSVQTNHNTESS